VLYILPYAKLLRRFYELQVTMPIMISYLSVAVLRSLFQFNSASSTARRNEKVLQQKQTKRHQTQTISVVPIEGEVSRQQ
jgi:hypothetical protein